MVHSFSIRKAHWKQVANINKEDDDHEDTEQISYDGLLFFDGHGRIEGTKALTVLAQHLKRLRLLVNPEGYCFQESMELADYADFGIHYLRLNDLFSWPHHGVDLATTSVWSRSELKYQVPKPKRTTTADHDRHHHGVTYLQKKLEELKRQLIEKDEELEKADEVKDEELDKLKREKDEEIRLLRKKKDEEKAKARKAEEALEKLKEEMDDAKESKDEETELLRKLLKRKDEEIRILKNKKEKDQEANSKRIDELEKLKDEMEDANEELQRILKVHEQNGKVDIKSARRIAELEKQKNEELERITREKNDEIAKIKKDLEEQSSKLQKITREKTEELQKRYLPMGSEGERLHLTRRRQVPPETFVYTEQSYDFVSSNMPRIEACLNVFNTAKFVDEENTTGWPSPTSFNVLIGKNNRGFDKNNWWFAKANHPEGGLTMLAYYDGKFSQFTSGPDRTIPLPFLKDATLAPYKPFFLLNVHSFGVKLAFMYRV
ncbi:Laminin subunit alpha-2 [Linum grandiflorum]